MRCVISTRCHFLSVVLIMALLLVSFAYVIPSVFAAQDDDVVIAGVPANFPPQYQVDAKTGKPYGFAIDVMDEVARRSGIKVRYVVYLSLIHISEPTRLGMISYAVFCLKKK